jgi:hypothetical protein
MRHTDRMGVPQVRQPQFRGIVRQALRGQLVSLPPQGIPVRRLMPYRKPHRRPQHKRREDPRAAEIMTVKTGTRGFRSIFQPSSNGSHSIKPWSVLFACAAGEAFLLYAILIAHTLSPVTALLIGHDPSRPGASARYREVFNWDGLIPTMLGSLLVVAAVWSAMQLTTRAVPKVSLDHLQIALTNPVSSAIINLTERAD